MFFSKLTLDDVIPPFDLREYRKRLRVAIVDDEPENFPIDSLQKIGFNIHAIKQVNAHVKNQLQAGEYDIIVLDIGGVAKDEPDDGWSVLASIKGVRPEQVVIAFSGQSFDFTKSAFFDLADDWLPKPTTAAKTEAVLNNMITEKLTLSARWQGVADQLRVRGLTGGAINSIEHRLAKTIRAREPFDMSHSRALLKDVKLTAEVGLSLVKLVGVALA